MQIIIWQKTKSYQTFLKDTHAKSNLSKSSNPSIVLNGSIKCRLTEGTSSWKTNFPSLKVFANIYSYSNDTTAQMSWPLKISYLIIKPAEISPTQVAESSSSLKYNSDHKYQILCICYAINRHPDVCIA